MKAKEYLNRLLVRYAGTFDIYIPYHIEEYVFDAYGFFKNHEEKYILTRRANLWTRECFEHCLFLTVNEVTADLIEEMKRIILEYVEPVLVLKGNKYPGENHMYSYMSIILISDKKPSREVAKMLKSQKYDKGYMMNIRGFSNYQICLVSMEDEKVLYNKAANKKKKLLNSIFKEVRDGKTGFQELWDQGVVTPYEQQ